MNDISTLSGGTVDTRMVAMRLAQSLQPGDVITISGDLGVGKTVFAQGLATGLGIEDKITSPTFSIAKCYSGNIKFNHIDAYRLTSSDGGIDAGLDEIIGEPNSITVIEWASNIPELIPQSAISVTIERVDAYVRKITISRRPKC